MRVDAVQLGFHLFIAQIAVRLFVTGRGSRRARRGRRGGFAGVFSRLADEPAGEEDAQLEQPPHGYRQQRLGNDVRRRQQHSDHKGTDDDIGSFGRQTFRRRRPTPDQEDGGDGHLERHAEGEEQLENEVQVFGYVRHHRDALRGHPGQESEHQRKNGKIGERHARIEEQCA